MTSSPFDVAGSGPSSLHDGSSLQQLNAMTPPSPSSSSSQSQVQMLRWLHMQQQYLLNQIQIGNLQSGSVPSLPLNLQNYQQLLSQHLVQMQKKQQQLTQQLKLTGAATTPGSGVTNSHNYQINLKLQQTQQVITQINDQLALISHLSSSPTPPGALPKSLSPKPHELGFLGSSQMPIGAAGSGSVVKQVGGTVGGGRSHSTDGIVGMDEGKDSNKTMMFGVPNIPSGGYNNPLPSHISSRSTSRLHQIISGSSNCSDGGFIGGMAGDAPGSLSSVGSPGSSPFSPPHGGSSLSSYSSGVTEGLQFGSLGTPISTSGAPPPGPPTGKSFCDIQEFKPGVPWQMRNIGQEPTGAQHLSKQNSMPGGSRGFDVYTHTLSHYGAASPLPDSGFAGAASAPFSSGPFPSSGGNAVPHKYMRSNSAGSASFYRTGGTSGFSVGGGGKRLNSPATGNKHSNYYNFPGGPRSDVQQGVGGWNHGTSQQEPPGIVGYGNSGHAQANSFYPPSAGRQGNPGNPLPQVNTGALPSWKQHYPVQPAGSRRMTAPPSSLPPRGGKYIASNSTGGTPIGSHNLFYTSSSSSSGSSFPSTPAQPVGDTKWGPFPSNTSSLTSPPNMSSSSVWGSSPLSGGSDQPHSHTSLKNQWGTGDTSNMSRLWNQSLDVDALATTKSVPWTRGMSVDCSDPSSSPSGSLAYNPSLPPLLLHGTTASADKYTSTSSTSSVSTPSLPSVSSTWGQEETHKGLFSPEPSFAEWQAGKKAHLSVVKPPSDVASPWLIIRNVTNQV